MTEVPEQYQLEPSRGRSRGPSRMTTLGQRLDDGSTCLVLVVYEADGSWTIHGLGDVAIRLTRERMAVLAGEILVRAR